MTDAVPENASRALWAKCGSCGHIWPAAYYPMELAKIGRILEQHGSCPKCGGEGFMARQHEGVLLEGHGA